MNLPRYAADMRLRTIKHLDRVFQKWFGDAAYNTAAKDDLLLYLILLLRYWQSGRHQRARCRGFADYSSDSGSLNRCAATGGYFIYYTNHLKWHESQRYADDPKTTAARRENGRSTEMPNLACIPTRCGAALRWNAYNSMQQLFQFYGGLCGQERH